MSDVYYGMPGYERVYFLEQLLTPRVPVVVDVALARGHSVGLHGARG